MSDGLKLIDAVIRRGNRTDLSSLRDYLFVQDERAALQALREHFRRYGELPSTEVFREHGFQLPVTNQSVRYHRDRCHKRAVFAVLRDFHGRMRDALRDREVEAAIGYFSDVQREIRELTGGSDDIAQVMPEMERLVGEAEDRTFNPTEGISFGWEPLDEVTGGIKPSDLVVLVARPEIGKTWAMLKMADAAHASGRSVGFLSMEMSTEQIATRALAIRGRMKPDCIRKRQLSEWGIAHAREAIDVFGQGPGYAVMRGDLARSVDDVERFLDQENPEILFIDASYLLAPSGRHFVKNRFEQISIVVEQLRQVALRRNIPVICSVQFGRSVKRKKRQEADLENIYGSDAIGQCATIVLGLQLAESDERRKIEVLKNREGTKTEFDFYFRFDPANFDTVSEMETEAELNEQAAANADYDVNAFMAGDQW